jgi:glucose/arabinose dehydrogenase
MALTDRRGFVRGSSAVLGGLASLGAGRAAAAEPFLADTERYQVRVTPLVLGLDHPWGLDFLPGGDILVTERAGRLRIVRGGGGDSKPITGVPTVVVGGQGGLLDVALHPRFASNRLVYVTYAGGAVGATFTGLARAKLGQGRLEGLQVLFESRPRVNSKGHYGSRIAFDGKCYIFVSVGDRQDMQRAQRLGETNGKIVRLREDGRVPSDNPFVGREGARPEIWSLGIRSPQGLAFQPGTGRLWECEHGPKGGDEVNIIRRGRNYGWPVITYGVDYDGSKIGIGTRKEGMEQPVRYWTPSIAPSGLSFYDGDLFPAWRGNLFMGALKYELVVRMELDATGQKVAREERFLEGALGRIRQVKPGPDGRLYVLTDLADGGLWAIEPA